jgi:hypothetical protein
MNYSVTKMTRRQIIKLIRHGKLNPNPLGQRDAVPSRTKPIGIINAMIEGYFTGAMVFRDIREDEEAKMFYPNYDFLVIDAGHRCRALVSFDDNRIVSKYGKISEIDADSFLDTEETVISYKCTAAEATQIFRTINTVTEVNEMEMIMANEDSQVATFIRKQTRAYQEYKNQAHPLFGWKIKRGTEDLRVPLNFSGNGLNPRRAWDELVAVLLVKCLNGQKNVDAGYPVISALVEEDEPLSKTVMANVKTALDAAKKTLKFARDKRYSKVTFGAFQLVYFELLGQGARIIDFGEFSRLFWKANAILDRKYRDMDAHVSSSKKGYVISSVKKGFGDGAEQSKLAKQYLDVMGDLTGVVNFSARSASMNEKYNDLALKGFMSADGEVLEYSDAEWSHTVPHAEGGTEATMERKSINRLNPTMAEQMLILQGRRHPVNGF